MAKDKKDTGYKFPVRASEGSMVQVRGTLQVNGDKVTIALEGFEPKAARRRRGKDESYQLSFISGTGNEPFVEINGVAFALSYNCNLFLVPAGNGGDDDRPVVSLD